MSTSVLEVPLCDATRERLEEIAMRARRTEGESAATLIVGALAADEVEIQTLRECLAQADAGGAFARPEDVPAWLTALSEGRRLRVVDPFRAPSGRCRAGIPGADF